MDRLRKRDSDGRVWLLAVVLTVTSCYSDNGGVAGPDLRPVREIQAWWGSELFVAVGDSLGRQGFWTIGVDGDYLTRKPTVVVTDTTVAAAGLIEITEEYYQPNAFELWLVGKTLGRTTVTLQVDTVSLELTVLTGPDSIDIAGLPDSLMSTQSVQLTATAFDANGQEMPGIPFSWRAGPYVEVFPGGRLTAGRAGTTWLSVRVEPPDEAYGVISEGLDLRVYPTSFPGTIGPAEHRPGQRLTLRPATAAYTPFEIASLGGGPPPFTISNVNGTLTAVFPPVDSVGVYQFRVVGQGFESVDYVRVTSLDPLDELEPNDDPLTAPAAVNGAHVIVLSGPCGAGLPLEPGADCSDFLTVANTTADTMAVTASVEWRSQMDVDVLWADAAFTTTFGSFDGANRFSGPGGEGSQARIPPGATWRLWINVHESHGVPYDVLLLRIDGIQ